MPSPLNRNTVGPFAWTSLTEAAGGGQTTVTVQMMRLYLAQERQAMEQARQALAAGNGDLALVCAYRAGAHHANYQQAADQLSRLGLDSTKILLDRGST